MKVKDLISKIIDKCRVEELPAEHTCDKLITGSLDMEIIGVASTFMATIEVINKCVKENINFIITHEPTWYTGMDNTEWLLHDPVYTNKLKLINDNNISIWRFHDHMHMAEEDGIYRGFINELDWNKFLIPHTKDCFEIPEISLQELSLFLKKRFNMEVVQTIGNPKLNIKRLGVLVGGSSLGLGSEHMPMEMMRDLNLDIIICGEITEWTLCSYARDASMQGMNKGLIILGHEVTEEPGMKHLVKWLRPLIEDRISIDFIDSKEPFKYY